MVVISAAICDKAGDILLARQYQNLTKHQLEENMRNFSKLITSDQQHTFVETEYVRYVYLPLDNMYLVLLAKKNSNIIEDQETIRLLHKIVQRLCPAGVSEANVLKRDFDILLCFDDVISFGLRESVSLSQVQSALEMESAEEKYHIMQMKQKQAEQKEAAKRHQMEMAKKRAIGTTTSNNSISSSSYGSYGSSNIEVAGSTNLSSSSSAQQKILASKQKNDEDEGVYRPDNKPVYNSSIKPTALAPKKGMVLGKKKPVVQETLTSNQKEISGTSKQSAQVSLQEQIEQENSKKSEIKVNPLKAPVDIEIAEKISCQMTRDGTLTSLDINGDIFIQLYDPSKTHISIQFEYENLKMSQMKPHVNLNKQLWTDKKQIALKNTEAPFPVNTKLPSVKYRYSSTNSQDLPFTLTCWFTDGTVDLEMEFNSEQKRFEKLEKIEISFNYPTNENPNVNQSENADYEVNTSNHSIIYTIPSLSSSNSTSNIQFGFSTNLTEDDIFPFDVNFTLPYTFFQIKPLAVANLDDNNQLLKFDVISKIVTDKYQIN